MATTTPQWVLDELQAELATATFKFYADARLALLLKIAGAQNTAIHEKDNCQPSENSRVVNGEIVDASAQWNIDNAVESLARFEQDVARDFLLALTQGLKYHAPAIGAKLAEFLGIRDTRDDLNEMAEAIVRLEHEVASLKAQLHGHPQRQAPTPASGQQRQTGEYSAANFART